MSDNENYEDELKKKFENLTPTQKKVVYDEEMHKAEKNKKIASILIVAGIVLAIVAIIIFTQSVSAGQYSTTKCPSMGEEGWFNCTKANSNAEFDASSRKSGFIAGGVACAFSALFFLIIGIVLSNTKKMIEREYNLQKKLDDAKAEDVKNAMDSKSFKKCKYCGTSNPKGEHKCSNCGASL